MATIISTVCAPDNNTKTPSRTHKHTHNAIWHLEWGVVCLLRPYTRACTGENQMRYKLQTPIHGKFIYRYKRRLSILYTRWKRTPVCVTLLSLWIHTLLLTFIYHGVWSEKFEFLYIYVPKKRCFVCVSTDVGLWERKIMINKKTFNINIVCTLIFV